MRIPLRNFYIFLFLAAILAFPFNSQKVNAASSGKILLIHSYHPGYKWTDDITLAVKDVLTRQNNHELFVEFLDTKRHVSNDYLDEQVELLFKKYEKIEIDTIICVDNNSLNFALAHRESFFPKIPIVFCGVNSFHEWMLHGMKNITGVNEEVDLRKTIDLMLLLHPEAKRIVVINDETETGEIIRNEALQVSINYTDIQWYMPAILTIEELREEVLSLDKGDLLLLGNFGRDFNGKNIDLNELIRLVTTDVKVPIYGLWDFYLGKGIIGGYLVSAKFQGKRAAEMAASILAGQMADEIPIITKSPNHYFIDYQVSKQLKVDLDKLPAETIVVNRPPDFYNSHKEIIWVVLTALAILTSLSIFLLFTVVRKNKAEAGLRDLTTELSSRVDERTRELSVANLELQDREKQLQHLLSNLSGMVYRCKNDEHWTILYISEASQTITGYSPDDLVNNRIISYAEVIDERDREYVSVNVKEAIRAKKHFTFEYRIKTRSGQTKWVWEQGLALYDNAGNVEYLDGIISDISDKKALELNQQKLAIAVQQTDDLVILTDISGEIEYVNPAFERVTGYSLEEVLGKNPRLLKSDKMGDDFYAQMWDTLNKAEVWRGRIINRRKNGSKYVAEVSISPIRNNKGELINYVGLQRDITHEISLEKDLRQAQKLEAIGTLAGGIAHEINTPTQFVASNLDFFLDCQPDFKGFLDDCFSLCRTESSSADRADKLRDLKEQYDIDYLMEEIPQALKQSLDGVNQIAEIVRSMKQFAHPGETHKTLVNLNDAITNTVTVCRNEWKYVADIDYSLASQLPEILCHHSELNQVILNIIINASHAIEGKLDSDEKKGKITISTKQIDSIVEIAIEDNGGGIESSILERIFDPFFTTKAPGKGTGQGLAIAHTIITEKHQGELTVESEKGAGTTFYIRLPIEASQ